MQCANKELQEWKDLVKVQGEGRAGILWANYDGEVPSSFYLEPSPTMVKDLPKQERWGLSSAKISAMVDSYVYDIFEVVGYINSSKEILGKWSKVEKYLEQITEDRIKSNLEKGQDAIASNYKSVQDNWEEFSALLKNKLVFLGLKPEREALEVEDPDAEKEKGDIIGETALTKEKSKSVTAAVKSLLLPLHTNEVNEHTGQFSIVPVSKTWGILVNNLANIVEDNTSVEGEGKTLVTKMLEKIQELSGTYPYLAQLHAKLVSKDLPQNTLIQFVTNFDSQNVFYNATVTEIDDDGDIVSTTTFNADSQNGRTKVLDDAFVFVQSNLFIDGKIDTEQVEDIKILYNKLEEAYESDNMPKLYSLIEAMYLDLGVNVNKKILEKYVTNRLRAVKGGEAAKEVARKKLFLGGRIDSLMNPFDSKKQKGSLFTVTNWDEKLNPISNFKSVIGVLAEYIAEYSNIPGGGMVPGPDGKNYYSIIENNVTAKTFQSWRNQPALLRKFLSKSYHKHSYFGPLILEDNIQGNNAINLEIMLTDRIGDNKATGYSDRVNSVDDLYMKMNKVMDGYFSFMTPADKSVLYELSGLPVLKTEGDFAIAIDHMYDNYFLAEIEREKVGPKDVKGFKHDAFYWFPNLNGDSAIYKEGTKDIDVAYVKSKIKESLELLEKQFIDKLVEDDLATVDIERKVYNFKHALSDKYLREYGEVTPLIKDIVVNSIIGNIENTMLFTGDPAYYKDLPKRAYASNATGTNLVYFKDDNDPVSKTFKVSISNDLEISSDALSDFRLALTEKWKPSLGGKTATFVEEALSPYKMINETDAQGFMTPTRYRTVLRMAGQWSAEKQEAYEKLLSGDGELSDLLLMQPLKGQHFELVEDGLGTRPVFLKYSQAVLWPSLVEGTLLENVYKHMVKYGVDEHIFNSGVKVGSPGKNVFSAKEILSGENLSKEISEQESTLTLNNFNWKIQQTMPSKYLAKRSATEATQLPKNIQANINLEEAVYDGMTGREMVTSLNAIQSVLSDRGLAKLTKKWFSNGVVSEDKIYEDLIESLIKEGASQNIISALEKRAPFETVLGMADKLEPTLLAKITAAATKPYMPGGALIQISSYGYQKMEGKDLTQLNSLGGIKWLQNIDYLKGPRVSGKGKLIRAQVLIPHSIITDLRKKHGQVIKDLYGVEVDRLSGKQLSEILGDSLEGIIGYRIPNQSMSSIDTFDVVGVLPDTAGDSIVVYRELPAKTGADFDIDKMYVMVHNLVFNKKTAKIEKVKFLDVNVPVEERHKAYYMSEMETKKKRAVSKTIRDAVEENKEVIAELEEIKLEKKELADKLRARGVAFKESSEWTAILQKQKDKYTHLNDIKTLREDEYADLFEQEIAEGNMLSVEEFSQLPIWEQNTVAALQNKKLELYDNILRNSAGHVVTPLDAAHLTEDAYYLTVLERKGAELAKAFLATSPDDRGGWIKKNLLNFIDLEEAGLLNQQDVKFRNLAGKAGTGQTANHLTHVPGSQQVGLRLLLNLTYPGWENGIDLSRQINDNGLFITDVISAWLNAYVDNAKDPYISFINNNTKTANAVFLLLRAGADMKWVNRMMVQPIIKDYVKFTFRRESNINKADNRLRQVDGPVIKIDDTGELLVFPPKTRGGKTVKHKEIPVERFLREYFKEWKEVATAYTHMSNKQLEEQIVDPDVTTQLGIFKEYLKIERAGELLGELTTLTKSDTDGATSDLLSANKVLNSRKNLIDSGYFENADKIFSETQQNTYTKNTLEFAVNNFDNLLLTGNAGVAKLLDHIIEVAGIMDTKDNRATILKHYKAYLYSSTPFFNLTLEEKKYLKGSFHNDMIAFLDESSEDSALAKVLSVKSSENGRFIATVMGKVDPIIHDAVWKDWEKLLEDDSVIKGTTVKKRVFAQFLVKYAYYNSGFIHGKNVFFQYIPESFLEATGLYNNMKETKNYLRKGVYDRAFVEQFVRNRLDLIQRFFPEKAEIQGDSYIIDKVEESPEIFGMAINGARVILVKSEVSKNKIKYTITSPLGESGPRNFFDYSYGKSNIKRNAEHPRGTTLPGSRSIVTFKKPNGDYTIEGLEKLTITTKSSEVEVEGVWKTLESPVITDGNKSLTLWTKDLFDSKEAALQEGLRNLRGFDFNTIETVFNNCK